MENQPQQNQEVQKKAGRKYIKVLLGVVAIIVIAVLLFVGIGTYKQWQMRKSVEKFAEALKQMEQIDYQRAMADTYGGKTPQETLQMYIDAVEKGDFELASKYFTISEQEKELNSLRNSQQENIANVLGILRTVEIVDMRAMLEKSYEESSVHSMSESKEDYVKRLYEVYEYDIKATMSTKLDGYDFSVDFRKYPNGIWKIMEI